MPVAIVEANWLDNNGRKAEVRFGIGEQSSFPDAFSRANAIVSAISAISNAVFVEYRIIWRVRNPSAPAPAPDSDVEANLLLFYGNDTNAASFRLPSPRPLPVDMVGPYRAVRLDMDAPEVLPLLTQLGSGLADTNTPGGAAWPLPLLAGGFTRYRGP